MRRLLLTAFVVLAATAAYADGMPAKPKPAPKAKASPAPVPSPAAPVVEPIDIQPEPLAIEEVPIVEVDVEPAPLPLPSPASEPGFNVAVVISAQSVMGAGAESKIRPSALLEAEGPVAWQNTTPLRMFARLRLLGLPGEAFDFTSVDTIRAVDAGFGTSYRVGRAFIGDQELWTSVIGEWGFSTALPPEQFQQASTHHKRHLGVGFMLEERTSGAWFSTLVGQNQVVGTLGWGQVMLAGAVPINIRDKGVFVIGGDAALGIGNPCDHSEAFCRQQDFVSIEVGISIPDLIAVMK